MKKYAFICIAILFVTACEKRQLNFENPIWDINRQSEAFHKLAIISFEGREAINIDKEVIINAEKSISVYMSLIDASDGRRTHCKGHAEISEQDYNKLMNLITNANLFEYEPPLSSDPDCLAPSYDSLGHLITYMRNDDTYHEIFSLCKMNIKVHDLIDTASEMASTYIKDCTEESLVDVEGPFLGVEDEVGEDEFCGSSTFAECENDDDCMASGCSMEACHGVDEMITSMCVTKPCADSKEYGMTCTCENNKCQWM